MTTNAQVAHEFFYSGFDKSRKLSGMSVSYDKNRFNSYYTTIGYVTTDKAGYNVTLLSRDNMSNTTAKHLISLRSASPYSCLRVELRYGERLSENKDEALQEIAENFKRALGVYSRQKMSLAKNRNDFIDCYLDAKRFSEKMYTLDFLKDFEKPYIDVTENVDQIKAEQRRIDKAEAAVAKEQLRALLTKQSLVDLDPFCYSGKLRDLIAKKQNQHFKKEAETEIKKLSNMSYSELQNYSVTNPFVREDFYRLIREAAISEAKKEFESLKSLNVDVLEKYKSNNYYLNALVERFVADYYRDKSTAEIKNSVDSTGYAKTLAGIIDDVNKLYVFKNLYVDDYSIAYVCYVNHTFKTTKGITIPEKEGRIALKAWKLGKLKVGDSVNIYKVLSIGSDYVKIGCHTIPTKNLEELCEILGI